MILRVSKLQGPLPDGFKSATLNTLFDPSANDPDGNSLTSSLNELFLEAEREIESGTNILILSDRQVSKDATAIPALLACAGLHHHPHTQRYPDKVSLIVESGEPREVQHFALLLGYGADLINPYLSLETIRYMISEGNLNLAPEVACKNFLKANLSGS